MRTTLNLDDDVVAAARELAALRGRTLGEVVSELARAALMERRGESNGHELRNGVPVLPAVEGARLVTSEDVARLLDDEP